MSPFVAVAVTLSLLVICIVPARATDDDPEIAFNNHCRECHTIKVGDNRLGPSLHGIVGAEAGKVEGFKNYSGGLQGFKWDEGMLDKFIANPASVASNTNMQYPGVADAAERKKIIEFLKKNSGPQ